VTPPRRRKGFAAAAITFAVIVVGALGVGVATGDVRWALRFVLLVTVLALAFFLFALQRPMGRVLKHTACSHCSRQILFEHEAEICADCDAGLHARCVEEHRSARHAGHPFRTS
jgi:hypothetical protein